MQNIKPAWQQPLTAAICEQCDWHYLLPQTEEMPVCPHCYQDRLTPLEESHPLEVGPPELILPFDMPTSRVQEQLGRFAKSFPFTPHDLRAETLNSRLRRVYLPAWLVDSDVAAVWQAEAGFDYQVVSHQESFRDGDWQTREVTETKIRWEARAGQLQRHYDNVYAPALEEIADVGSRLGSFDREKAVPYEAGMLEQSLVRLPNRDPIDAWPEAQPAFKELAAGECREAAGADHIRQYRWRAEYGNQHWTLLLLPVYSTWYLDDDQQPLPVLLNGRSGHFFGLKRASAKKARRAALMLAILAALLFILTVVLLLIEPSLTLLSALLAFFTAVGAILPIAFVSRFNRSQATDIPIPSQK